MRLVLHQEFPLGRFHATPWGANPFDDPHGEWPPSPWRLVRAIVARWYQWSRESESDRKSDELDRLVAALCVSTYRFHLPVHARKGRPLRQYHPTEFGMDPPNFKAHEAVFAAAAQSGDETRDQQLKKAGALWWRETEAGLAVRVGSKGAKKKREKIEKLLGQPSEAWRSLFPDSGLRSYGTSLAQDNYWCVAPDEPVWWFLEGDQWTDTLVSVLDRCLERVTYLGRAETLTRIRRASDKTPDPNCVLSEQRGPGSVPVLTPCADATRLDVERVTDHPDALKASIPTGARTLFAVRPVRPPSHERREPPPVRRDCRLLQFAVGWHVAPDTSAIVRLTARFRGVVLRELLRIKTRDPSATWSRAGSQVRESVADMFGKDAEGKPLAGHRHAEFMVWVEGRVPTRLFVFRDGRAFDADEQAAVLLAAQREFSWTAAGPQNDTWKVRLVPLDRAVPPPPGFDGVPARVWESLTPYVPPRHHLRGGKLRESESLEAQIRRELSLRVGSDTKSIVVEQLVDTAWVSVHVPLAQSGRRASLGSRRGYTMRLTFSAPVTGPLRLGHSSSFGLGLFKPLVETGIDSSRGVISPGASE
jgi:CRISPR-associated protein Csb2